MRRIVFTAVALCLALGLGCSKNDKQSNSRETEKPSPATSPAQTSSAQTRDPLVTPGAKPSTTQTATPAQTVSKVLARPANWALGAGNTDAHKLYEPGEGLPAAMQDQIHALVQQAISLEDKGDLTGAVDTNKKVIKLDPKAAVTMNVIAGLYGRLGDFHSEADWARKAIALDPKFTGAYINFGNAMGSAGRPAEARKAFSKVIELNSKSPLGVYSLGVVAERQFKYRVALGYYEQSTKIDPKFEDGYYRAAAMHAHLKEFEAALAALGKVQQLNPNADTKDFEASLVTGKVMAQATANTKPALVKVSHKHWTTRGHVARSVRISAKTKHHRHHRRVST